MTVFEVERNRYNGSKENDCRNAQLGNSCVLQLDIVSRPTDGSWNADVGTLRDGAQIELHRVNRAPVFLAEAETYRSLNWHRKQRSRRVPGYLSSDRKREKKETDSCP